MRAAASRDTSTICTKFYCSSKSDRDIDTPRVVTYLGVGLRRRLTLAKVLTNALESLLCPAVELSAADVASAGFIGNICVEPIP